MVEFQSVGNRVTSTPHMTNARKKKRSKKSQLNPKQTTAGFGFVVLSWILHTHIASYTRTARQHKEFFIPKNNEWTIHSVYGVCNGQQTPAPEASWLARRTAGRMSWVRIPSESCVIFQPWLQSWECYGPTGKAGTTQPSFIHFTSLTESVALIAWPGNTAAGPGLVNPGIIMTISAVRGPVK